MTTYPTIAVFTGSRDLTWDEGEPAIRYQLSRLPFGSLVLHGDCPCRLCRKGAEHCRCEKPTSADIICDRIARECGHVVERWPADWGKGLAEGPRRSFRMIDRMVALAGDYTPHYCLAFPLKGSKGTIRAREYAHVKVVPVRQWWD